MVEFVARASHSVEIQLLYASIVWLAAWLVTSIRGSATTKYWIWVATSLNFIVPVSTVLDLMRPARLFRVTPLNVIRIAGNAVSMNGRASAALLVVWLLGASMMLLRLFLRIRADRRVEASRQVPAVDGILRPQITLPDGIDRLLTKDELNAVLIHELTHAKRRDNLIRLLHEVTLCALWFH
ncbi:MAG TPA: M56 family metallopeptidase, partial [Thermoanaerobaculia bacterium]